ncbi:protein SSUH2 homolog isoform X2 [Monodon monoceros]|uniref:protein SSUH2 homolog isoform X2 n=1 Tax=Monodon monoceros TaxID=40151 RepID=UPI0010F69528|nr:protein SSUH2 homolog isoform X2 [Monodon monoceros]
MDLSFEAERPLAPPAELLERLPSCDCLLQGDRCCRSWNPGCQIFFPPSEAPGRPQEQRCWSSFLEHRVPVVTEEVAREALLSFVDSKCCYGSAAAGDLVILELKQQVLRRYRLETFSESRISEWTFQPFTNHSVDGPQRGTSPRLWDIKVQVPPMFQEDTRKFQVPHSSLVKALWKPSQKWSSSHHGLNCYTSTWDADIMGVGLVKPGAAGTWKTRPRRAFTLRNATDATGMGATSAAAATGPARCGAPHAAGPSAEPGPPGGVRCARGPAGRDAAHAQGGGTRPVPPARARRSCCTSSSWSSCGRTACLSLCLSTSWTALGTCLLKPEERRSLRMKTRWCTPSWTSPCGKSLWPPSGVSPSTALRWPPEPASCSSARPLNWSPSRKFVTGTKERLTSTTSTAPTTKCTWWITPRGTAVAAPSSDIAHLPPEPATHVCPGDWPRSLS